MKFRPASYIAVTDMSSEKHERVRRERQGEDEGKPEAGKDIGNGGSFFSVSHMWSYSSLV